jgi:hypothetical protein
MDKYIMARMPAALPGETVAAAPAAAEFQTPAQVGNAPGGSNAPSAALQTPAQVGNAPGGSSAPTVAATPSVADAVAASGEPDNVTGVDAAVAANAAQAATPPAKATPVSDPKVVALQKQLIAAGAKITADGRMGPATRAAQKQFGGNVTDANQSSAETARLARANTGAATAAANQSSAETARLNRQAVAPAAAVSPRPGLGMAAQFEWDRQYAKTHNANGTAKGAQAATPAPVDVAKIDAEIKRFSSGNNMSLQANKDYVAGLEKKKTGGQAATPAPAPAAPLKPGLGSSPMRPAAPKTPSTAPVAMGATNADRRDFEESVSRMRRLSTLLKG